MYNLKMAIIKDRNVYLHLMQENILYSTNKYCCVRRVHTLYISYFIEHNGDDKPHDCRKIGGIDLPINM